MLSSGKFAGLSSGEFVGVGYPRIEGSSKITFKGLSGPLGSTGLGNCPGSTGLRCDVGGGIASNPFLGGPLILRGPSCAPTGLGCDIGEGLHLTLGPGTGYCSTGCDIACGSTGLINSKHR